MRRSSFVPLSIITSLVLAGCGSDASVAGDSGIGGVVVRGPTCPVEMIGSPCPDLPVAVTIRVLSDGEEVTTVRSDDAGRFRISLEPGEYVLEVRTQTPESARPIPVRVDEGAFAQVTVTIDTGIR